MKKNRFCTFFLFLLLSVSGYAQVYNYVPVSYFNIETNPTVLTSSFMDGRIKVIQKNALSVKKPFSYSSLRFSKKLNSPFFGVGLSLNHTSMGNDIYYNHVGLGLGYRIVLFDKIYLKLGTTYKVIDSKHSLGSFDYFSYTPSTIERKGLNEKINLAFSFTGESEMVYLSVSSLNLDLPWSKTEEVRQFPRYYLFNVGNLMSLFGKSESREISYSAMSKFNSEKGKWIISHYVNSILYQIPYTRTIMIRLGARIGFLEQQYYHFIPFATLFSERWVINTLFNFHLDKRTFNSEKQSTIQLSLLYKFY